MTSLTPRMVRQLSGCPFCLNCRAYPVSSARFTIISPPFQEQPRPRADTQVAPRRTLAPIRFVLRRYSKGMRGEARVVMRTTLADLTLQACWQFPCASFFFATHQLNLPRPLGVFPFARRKQWRAIIVQFLILMCTSLTARKLPVRGGAQGQGVSAFPFTLQDLIVARLGYIQRALYPKQEAFQLSHEVRFVFERECGG